MCEIEMSTIKDVTEKIDVISADIIVSGTAEKPYYEIRYTLLEDGTHTGYGSYDLSNVLKWKEEYFNIIKIEYKALPLKVLKDGCYDIDILFYWANRASESEINNMTFDEAYDILNIAKSYGLKKYLVKALDMVLNRSILGNLLGKEFLKGSAQNEL